MLVAPMDLLSGTESSQRPVVPVSGRCAWLKGLAIAGTVDAIAAATETLTPGAIFTADLASAGNKVLFIPPNSTYLELGAWGDAATAFSPTPVIEIWRTHGLGAGAAGQTVAPDNWSLLRNVLGASSVTLSGTIIDTQGSGTAKNRYTVDEGTYQQFLFDVRGARAAVVRLTTAGGGGGNWSLWHRFL